MIDVNKLSEEQTKLAKKIVINDVLKNFKTFGGVEQAFIENKIISSVVVCDSKNLEIIEKKNSIVDAKLNYKSGFLFYREGPAVIESFNKPISMNWIW